MYVAARFTSLWVEQTILHEPIADTLTFHLQGFHQYHDDHHHKQQQRNKTTLALLSPPGLLGGYRNQVIRLISLVRHAQQNDISQLLLPTILFSTTYQGQSNKLFFPIPMDEVFDIDFWNSFSPEVPMLVPAIENGDCWTSFQGNVINYTTSNGQDDTNHSIDLVTSIYNESVRKVDSPTFASPMTKLLLEKNSFLSPLYQMSRLLLQGKISIPKPRKLDLTPLVEHCSRPFVYGGGRGAGKLWNEYMKMVEYNNTSFSSVSLALIPNEKWRKLAHQCIIHYQENASTTDNYAPYVALHARVEVAMMNHRCGTNMEKNLTKIAGFVDSMVDNFNRQKENIEKLQGIFVAVSREGMLEHTSNQQTRQMAEENYQTLLTKTNHSEQLSFFECGELWMDQYYDSSTAPARDYYGSLIPSVMNFYLATKAAIFVGVAGSSWSTDVWTTRYHQGKGGNNFQYTPQGIIPVPNNGLPPPHKNCK
jgi:hypothetical protein